MDENTQFAHFLEYRGNLFQLYVCTVAIGDKYEKNLRKMSAMHKVIVDMLHP